MGRALAFLLACAAIVSLAHAGTPRSPRSSDSSPSTTHDAASADGVWEEIPLFNARVDHEAICDPVRGRMLVFGGREVDRAGYGPQPMPSDVWALSLTGTAKWTELEPRGTPPPGMLRPGLTYESRRDRMLVVGAGKVWALSLHGVLEWVELANLAPAPTGQALYDVVRDRLIVVGARVWAAPLDFGTGWQEIIGSAHSGVAIHDPIEDRLILFEESAGWPDGSRVNAHTLSLTDPVEWARLEPAGFPPTLEDNYEIRAAFDGQQNRALVVDVGSHVRTWSLSLGTAPEWTELPSADTGSAPADHGGGFSLIHDTVGDRFVVFGGLRRRRSISEPNGVSEVWGFEPASETTWRMLSPLGELPDAREHHAAVWDTRRQQMIVIGGQRMGSVGGVYAISLGEKVEGGRFLPSGTPAPVGKIGLYDAVRDRVLLFSPHGAVGELSLGEPPSWREPVFPEGAVPAVVDAVVHDSMRDRVLAFGASEVWELPLEPMSGWNRLPATGPPPASVKSAVYDPVRDRVLAFSEWMVWVLPLAGALEWTPVVPEGPPPLSASEAAAFYDAMRDRAILLFWEDYEEPRMLDLRGRFEWRILETGSPPPYYRRVGHSVTYDPKQDRIMVFAGIDDEGDYVCSDLWSLSFFSPVGVASEPAAAWVRGFPNPTSNDLTVQFALPRPMETDLRLFDVAGRLVHRRVLGSLGPGIHTVRMDTRMLASGMYWLRLDRGHETLTHKVCVLR